MRCFRHKWDGCKCSKCGKTRDEGHRYKWVPDGLGLQCYEKCSVCGKWNSTWQHTDLEWKKEVCIEQCPRCGYTREKHSYITSEEHPCTKRCSVCGKEIVEHTWNKCTCTVCGFVNNVLHDWEWISEGGYTGIKRCKICGKRDESGKMTMEEADRKRTEMYQNMDEGIR